MLLAFEPRLFFDAADPKSSTGAVLARPTRYSGGDASVVSVDVPQCPGDADRMYRSPANTGGKLECR